MTDNPKQEFSPVAATLEKNTSIPPFRSASSRMKWTTVFLIIDILGALATILSTSAQIQLLSGANQGHTITAAAAQANNFRQQSISGLRILLYPITAVFFFMWIHRAHRNLSALGATGLKYSPGWAVGGFFVPFLNLVRPFQVVTEIWKASDPKVSAGSSWQASPSTAMIGQWWGIYLANAVCGYAVLIFASGTSTVDSLLTASWIIIIATAITMISALLTIRMISAINARQELKYKTFATLGLIHT